MKFIPNTIKSLIARVKPSTVIIIAFGLIVGSVIGALLSVPIGKLQWTYSGQLAVAVAVISTVAFTVIFYFQKEALVGAFNQYWPFRERPEPVKKSLKKKVRKQPMVPLTPLLLDSSAVIDGRIVDILRTGFLEGELIVTSDILAEIKRIADSKEPLRKQRGRRGLEILEEMKKGKHLPFRYHKTDKNEMAGMDVDARLVQTAAQLKGKVLTTDYNLHKKAKIMGLTVLNVNELANMVKTVLLPGERFTIDVIQEGKSDRQGLGYLPDGTMVVVEEGNTLLGTSVEVEVKRLLQTDAGKMVFTTLVEDKSE